MPQHAWRAEDLPLLPIPAGFIRLAKICGTVSSAGLGFFVGHYESLMLLWLASCFITMFTAIVMRWTLVILGAALFLLGIVTIFCMHSPA